MIEIKVDLEPLKQLNAKLARRVIPKSAARSANRAVGAARSSARKHLKKNVTQQAKLFDAFKIKRATASGTAQTAALVMKGKGLPLVALKHDIVEIQTRRGLRLGVKVHLPGGPVLIPKAFLARLKPGGKEGIYRRKGQSRFPIESMYARQVLGGSEADVLAEPTLQAAMKKSATGVFHVAWAESFAEEMSR